MQTNSLVVQNRRRVNNLLRCAMAFSNYLREKREAAGFSQDKLARLVTARGHKVSAGNISNLERAYYKRQDGSESIPDRTFVVLAAEILGIDRDEALTAAG